jgi:hypothetical protein
VNYLKLININILLLTLLGCATSTIDESDISYLDNDNKYLDKVDGKHKYRLDYLVSGDTFSFSTYEIEGKSQYIQVLAKQGKVLAISQLFDVSKLYRPRIRKCTLFPFHSELDVEACFKDFNKATLALNDLNWLNKVQDVNISEEERKNRELTGTITISTILAPLLVPATLAVTPLLVGDYFSSKGTRKEFYLTLGENSNLPFFLQEVENQHKSEDNKKGTAYLASGVAIEVPEIAFGYIGNEIIWIQKSPSWACGGGFIFWGLKCTVGYHEDRHW